MSPEPTRDPSLQDRSRRAFVNRAGRISNLLLLMPAGLALLVLVLNIIEYRTRVISPSAALFYIGGPIAMLVLVATVRRAQPEAKVRATLTLLSTGITCYLTEAAFTYQLKRQSQALPTAETASAARVPFDRRSLLDFIEDLRRSGVDAVPALNPRVDLVYTTGGTALPLLPLGGVSKTLTVLCNDGGNYATYFSDRYGFHNQSDLYEPTRAKAALIGDSFTIGACVPPDRNIAGLLTLEGVPSLNLGMIGNGPLLELATLKEYAVLARPRLVLWMYFENDLGDLDAEKIEVRLMNYLQQSFRQDLALRQAEIDELLRTRLINPFLDQRLQPPAERAHQEDPTNLRDLPAMRFLLMEQFRSRLGPLRGPNIALLVRVLTEARRVTESWGGRLMFIYLPSWQSLSNYRYGTRQRAIAKRVAGQVGLQFLDILDAMRATHDPLSFFPFRVPGHYNEAGYQFVARAILSASRD